MFRLLTTFAADSTPRSRYESTNSGDISLAGQPLHEFAHNHFDDSYDSFRHVSNSLLKHDSLYLIPFAQPDQNI